VIMGYHGNTNTKCCLCGCGIIIRFILVGLQPKEGFSVVCRRVVSMCWSLPAFIVLFFFFIVMGYTQEYQFFIKRSQLPCVRVDIRDHDNQIYRNVTGSEPLVEFLPVHGGQVEIQVSKCPLIFGDFLYHFSRGTKNAHPGITPIYSKSFFKGCIW
jgi:hypothetical protein